MNQGYTIVAAKTASTALRPHVLVGLDPKLHDRAIAALRAIRAIKRLHRSAAISTCCSSFPRLRPKSSTTC